MVCPCKVDFFKDQKELISKNKQRQLNIFQISIPLGRVGEADRICIVVGRIMHTFPPPPRAEGCPGNCDYYLMWQKWVLLMSLLLRMVGAENILNYLSGPNSNHLNP